MKYSEEIRFGYSWSFMSPLVVSFLLSLYVAISAAIESNLYDAISAFIGSLLFLGFFSVLFSGFFCLVIGIPTYYLLRKLRIANGLTITSIGGFAAYLYSLIDNQNMFFQILYVAYGFASGFFFWFGTKQSHTPNKLNPSGAPKGDSPA